MAIKIQKNQQGNRFIRTFTADVDLAPLGTEGSIKVQYAAMQRADMEALNKQQIDDEQFCRMIIRGVSGIGDENGVEYPAAEQLDFVISDIHLCKHVMDTFNEKFTAEKRGN